MTSVDQSVYDNAKRGWEACQRDKAIAHTVLIVGTPLLAIGSVLVGYLFGKRGSDGR